MEESRVPLRTQAGYALGDHTLNLSLSALSLFYLFFLTEVVGLRPGLAGLVLLIGRTVDAFTDPAMGRLSDHTRWRWGRRRPYLALGAVPFGVTFAALWFPWPLEGELARFALLAAAYVAHTLASTVVSVPYVALLPEIALGYQQRTAMNTWRAILSVLGTLLAATTFRPLATALGGGPEGFAGAGAVFGLWLALPWLVVYRSTRERPDFQRPAQLSLREGFRVLLRHANYLRLCAFYLCGRIAVDVVGAMFLYYFHYWLRREEDFELTLFLLLTSVALWLPLWLVVSRRLDKHRAFIWGASWWIVVQIALFLVGPETPRSWVFAIAVAAGVGYAAADVMPWAMLGDVVDEDELVTGERREGIYAGSFTFLRKLGGASGVAAAGLLLELAGFDAGRPQSEATLLAIRVLASLVPAGFLALGVLAATGYPLTRVAHARIRERLERPRAPRGGETGRS